MKIFVLACAAATALFSILSTTTQAAECVVDPVIEANKQLAFDALDGIFNKKDPDAIDRYLGPIYLQHNPSAADGTDGLKAFLPFLPADARYEIGLLATENDLVWVHSRSGGAVNKSIVVDVYRVKDGRLVEHWDYIQAEVLQTVSGRPMFPITASAPAAPVSTAKRCGEAPVVVACVSKDVLKANKALAAAALDAFFNKKDTSSVDKYIGAEYLQHNPLAKDGPQQLKSLIGSLPATVTFELGAQVASDDLVWTQGRYSGVPGQNTTITIDIFRVKGNKLVEHWDVSQDEVPANQTVSGRPMFPIEP